MVEGKENLEPGDGADGVGGLVCTSRGGSGDGSGVLGVVAQRLGRVVPLPVDVRVRYIYMCI